MNQRVSQVLCLILLSTLVYLSSQPKIKATPQWNVEIIEPDPLYSEHEPPVVDIIDTGIDLNHPEFADNLWINDGETPSNGVDDDNNGYVDDSLGWDFVNDDNDPQEDNEVFHGTHTAGTLVGETIGAAPKTTLMVLKAFDQVGSGEYAHAAEAIRYAVDNGARIISMSLGGSSGNAALYSAVRYAYDHGVVMVAAAGNEGRGAIDYPAQYDEVIAVGSVDYNLKRSSFSNYGSNLYVVAPGEDINSTVAVDKGKGSVFIVNDTKYQSYPIDHTSIVNITATTIVDGGDGTYIPDAANHSIVLVERGQYTFAEMAQRALDKGAVGLVVYNNQPGIFGATFQQYMNVTSISISQEDGLYLKSQLQNNSDLRADVSILKTNYYLNSGTSMSVPLVAGMITLLLAKYPQFTRDEVFKYIQYGVTDLGLKGKDSGYGYGLINGSVINKILEDSESPMILGKPMVESYYLNDIDELDFTINITASDNVGIRELRITYPISNNQDRSFSEYYPTLSMGKEISKKISVTIPAGNNTNTVLIEVEDVNGNIASQVFGYDRDGIMTETTSKTTTQTNVTQLPHQDNNTLAAGPMFVLLFPVLLLMSLYTKYTRRRYR